jgi:hypothetical protein
VTKTLKDNKIAWAVFNQTTQQTEMLFASRSEARKHQKVLKDAARIPVAVAA